MKFINIDDLIDNAIAEIGNSNKFCGQAHFDEATNNNLQSLQVAERTEQLLALRAEAERLVREYLMQPKLYLI